MACNCKVNQKLDYLHKKYGNKVPVSKKTEISFLVKEKAKEILVFIITLIFLPVMLISVLYQAWFAKDKKISIKKNEIG